MTFEVGDLIYSRLSNVFGYVIEVNDEGVVFTWFDWAPGVDNFMHKNSPYLPDLKLSFQEFCKENSL